MKRWQIVICGLAVSSVLLAFLAAPQRQPAATPPPRAQAGADESPAIDRLPLQFEANEGQADASVQFLAHGPGYTVLLTPQQAVLVLTNLRAGAAPAVLRLQFPGAAPAPDLVGVGPSAGIVNYYLGRDPAQWHTGIPTYAMVRYEAIYPGINLIFYGNQQQLEHDFVVGPGADPSAIAMQVQGADALAIAGDGDLVLSAGDAEVRLRRPLIYQEVNGARRPISGGYALRGARQFGFEVAAYDPSRPLIIDPVLDYSSYFGGSGDDYGSAIATDSAGNIYITGATNSSDFPVRNPAQGDFGGGGIDCPSDQTPSRRCFDAFVTKLNPAGSAISYSTYLGLPGDDEGKGIAVDSAGNAYLTGYISLNSDSLPDAYLYKNILVAKLDAAGALSYLRWFGNTGSMGNAIAVDAAGRAYVTGETHGIGFPTTPDAIQPTQGELIDAFVSVLDPTASYLEYSTYLGGSGDNCSVCYSAGNAIAVDSAGMIYVTGQAAPSFPTTPNAYQRTFDGFWNAFVAQIDRTRAGEAGLRYSTYLGGKISSFGNGIAVGGSGKIYVTGATQADDFPTTAEAYDRTCGTDGRCNTTDNMVCDDVPPGLPQICHVDAKADVFVAKLDPSQFGAASLVFSTFVGGGGKDEGQAIAIDTSGTIYITGSTVSPNFPTVRPFQATLGGNRDVFVLKMNTAGSALQYATFMGGGGDDRGSGIAVDSIGAVHVTGTTGSVAFPTVAPLQPRAGGWEAFLARFSMSEPSMDAHRVFLPALIK